MKMYAEGVIDAGPTHLRHRPAARSEENGHLTILPARGTEKISRICARRDFCSRILFLKYPHTGFWHGQQKRLHQNVVAA